MAHFYPWPAGDGQLVYMERLVFGSGMVVSIVLALLAIRRRDFKSHGAWMIRGYAIGLGAGTQVLTHLPWFVLVGGRPGELARGLMMGAGWVINVVVAEWIIAKGRQRRSAGGGGATTLSSTRPMRPMSRAPIRDAPSHAGVE
jgi:hypothetical protein